MTPQMSHHPKALTKGRHPMAESPRGRSGLEAAEEKPQVHAVPAEGQLPLRRAEGLRLLVVDEIARVASPHLLPVELLGERLARVGDGPAIAGAKHVAVLRHLEDGRLAPVAAAVCVFGLFPDVPAALLGLSRRLGGVLAGILEAFEASFHAPHGRLPSPPCCSKAAMRSSKSTTSLIFNSVVMARR